MFVLTADQRRSRRAPDAVEEALGRLSRMSVGPFERTAGDELQGLVRNPAGVVACVRLLVCRRPFRLGIGVGAVDSPVPSSPRTGRGSAFVLAREALGRSRSAPQPVAVRADAPPELVTDAEAVLRLLVLVETRRSEAGHEVADLLDAGMTVSEAAARLGVTKQAVSQRLKVAGWHEARAARETCTRLLAEVDAAAGGGR